MSDAGDCVCRVVQRCIEKCCQAYLPGRGVNRDQLGGSPRARPFHCTSVGLTLAIAPNVGDSTVQFMCVGSAFALTLYKQSKIRSSSLSILCPSMYLLVTSFLTNAEKLHIFVCVNL